MPTQVTVRLSERQIQRLLTSPNGPVVRNLLVRGYRVQAQARRNLSGGSSGPRRIDTGRLRASITVQLITRRAVPVVRIGTDVDYALFIHNGTGLYGPKHQKITPIHAEALRFQPHGVDEFVFAKSVKGIRPNPFLFNALPAGAGTMRAE